MRSAFWWTMEVGLAAVGVFAGVAVLIVAALLSVMGAPRVETWRALGLGVALWAGGLAWGMFVNRGARWLARP